MSVRRRTAAYALGALLVAAAGTAAVMPSLVAAQQAPAPASGPQGERPLPGRHVEGRIAFLRAELKITDGQQAQWERVAAAMRANAKQMDQIAQQMRANRDQPRSAIEQLERRSQFAETRAGTEKTFLAAFKPLYDSLSDDQKKAADELFARSFGRHGPRRGR